MTGDKERLQKFQKYDGGSVSFGDKRAREITGHGKVHLNDKIEIQW